MVVTPGRFHLSNAIFIRLPRIFISCNNILQNNQHNWLIKKTTCYIVLTNQHEQSAFANENFTLTNPQITIYPCPQYVALSLCRSFEFCRSFVMSLFWILSLFSSVALLIYRFFKQVIFCRSFETVLDLSLFSVEFRCSSVSRKTHESLNVATSNLPCLKRSFFLDQ